MMEFLTTSSNRRLALMETCESNRQLKERISSKRRLMERGLSQSSFKVDDSSSMGKSCLHDAVEPDDDLNLVDLPCDSSSNAPGDSDGFDDTFSASEYETDEDTSTASSLRERRTQRRQKRRQPRSYRATNGNGPRPGALRRQLSDLSLVRQRQQLGKNNNHHPMMRANSTRSLVSTTRDHGRNPQSALERRVSHRNLFVGTETPKLSRSDSFSSLSSDMLSDTEEAWPDPLLLSVIDDGEANKSFADFGF